MREGIISNPILDKLPAHLKQYILPQHYHHYTGEDQAIWRYVMRKNKAFLPKVAHDAYLRGLDMAGIATGSIPSMYGMNRILKNIGWAACTVDGLIPSAAFMEFQAYNVLVIAADIRLLEHIEYTHTPDIIHESAGHAPMIAVPEYAEYLRRFGEIGAKAISSAKDNELFTAIRKLSILKENIHSKPEDLHEAETQVIELQNNLGAPSELQELKNLHWWTIEYGLIGTPENPKIYGAGLLSSIGESEWCLSDQVKKLPYSMAAAKQSFDVTRPQPQLFVTPDFAYLSEVLNEFANTMALRTGGTDGVRKLIESAQLGTIELSTGLQISGIFTHMIISPKGQVSYVQTSGPTALSYREKELIGHGTEMYRNGYGTALGHLKSINLAIEDMSPVDLRAYQILEGQKIQLHFEGDIEVSGKVITGTRNIYGKIMLISFENCTVKYQDQILFQPDWGIYNLAVGKTIVSAFAGPADFNSFDLNHHVLSAVPDGIINDPWVVSKMDLYNSIRRQRAANPDHGILKRLTHQALADFADEWLLLLELYELCHKHYPELGFPLHTRLIVLTKKNNSLANLITSGLALME